MLEVTLRRIDLPWAELASETRRFRLDNVAVRDAWSAIARAEMLDNLRALP